MQPADANHPLTPPQKPKGGAEKSSTRGALVATGPVTVLPSAPAKPPGLTAAPTMNGLFQALRRCYVLAVGLGLLAGVLTVLAVCYLMPAKYAAQARVKLTSRQQNPVISNRLEADADPSVWKANQIGIVKSPLVLGAALERVKGKYPHLAGASVEGLEGALKIDFTLGPEIMRIQLNGDDPEEAAALVNAIVDAYLAELDQQEGRHKDDVVTQLQETLRTINVALDLKLTDLHQRGIDDPQVTMLKYQWAMNRMLSLEKQYDDFKTEVGTKERRLAALKLRLKTVATDPVSPLEVEREMRASPLLAKHWENYLKNEDIIAETLRVAPVNKRQEYLAEPLRVKEQLKQAYATLVKNAQPAVEQKLRADAEEKIRQELKSLEQEVEELRGREVGLEKSAKAVEKQARDLDPSARPQGLLIVKLMNDVGQLKKEAEELKSTIHKLKAEPKLQSRVLRLQNAEAPTGRDYSRQLRFGGLGGLGMFLVGLLGVAVWEFRSRKVTAVDEVTQGLGMNVVGTLPALPLRSRRPGAGGATTPTDAYWQNRMAESVDAIRTLLMHGAKSDGLQVVLVTSALGGEGKTSLSSQLAASLARAWRKTLLIDGDLRNPAAHKLFELPLGPGFSEVLRGEADLQDTIRPTALSRLWLMPAGQWDAHAVQALAQEGVRTMFDHLKEQYDFIIVDSCPVLPVADTLLLGQHVDGVVFSILRDVSRIPAVHAAQQRLSTLAIPMLGAVVIGASGDTGNMGYQYPAVAAK